MGRETDFDLEAHAGRLAADGYTILPDFLSPADLAEARARIDALSDSHLWDEGRAAEALAAGGGPGLVPAVMPAGSAIVLQGNLIHRGGANRSAAPRLAVTHQYCQPWARTQENFFLGVPQARAAALSPRLQALLGYAVWPPFMGHVTGSHPLKALEPGWSEPVERQEAPARD